MVRGTERSIGSALSYQYLSAVSFTAFGGAFYIFIAKFLPTSEVGVVSLLLAITSLLNIIFSFGLPISAQHFISYNLAKDDQIEMYSLTKRFLVIACLLSMTSVGITLIVARPFALLFFHNVSYTSLVDTGALYIAALTIFGTLHGSALGLQIFKTDAIIYLSAASLSYFVGLVFLFVFHGIFYLLIGLSVSYIYGSIFYVVVIFTRRSPITETSRKTSLHLIFAYSWPIILSSLMGYGSNYVDRFVVAYFLDISTLGIYSFVLIVSSSLSFLAGPLVNILIPKLSEFFSLNDIEKLTKGVNLSSALMILIYSPLALGVAALSPIALSLLARSTYASGSTALMILLGVSSVFVLWNILSSVIYAVRKTRVYIIITSLTLISNILLSFLLIPRIGMVGASIANSSVIVISFMISYYFAITKEVKKYDWVTVMKVWLSSLTMFVVVFIERTQIGNGLDMLPLYIFTGAIVYTAMLNLTHSLRRLSKDEFIGFIPVSFGLRKSVQIILGWAF